MDYLGLLARRSVIVLMVKIRTWCINSTTVARETGLTNQSVRNVIILTQPPALSPLCVYSFAGIDVG